MLLLYTQRLFVFSEKLRPTSQEAFSWLLYQRPHREGSGPGHIFNILYGPGDGTLHEEVPQSRAHR